MIAIVFLATALTVGAAAGVVVALMSNLPQIQALESFEPSSTTRILSADGHEIDELFVEKRHPVPLEDIPADLKAAVLATEDRDFYHHGGINIKGIVRAIIKDLIAGDFRQGASTITQQLARTLFLSPRKTLGRKIREAILAIQIERHYTKDEILALYLNQIYLGDGAYGVAAAAQTYFGKPLSRLTLAECAMIAGLPKGPTYYSPRANIARARDRRDTVLSQMRATGVISEAQYRQAVQSPIDLAPRKTTTDIYGYFNDFLQPRLEAAVGATRLYHNGLTVRTTIETWLQEAVMAAQEKGMARLEARMKKSRIPTEGLQCAVVAIDVRSGAILAMSGGRDYQQSPFNRAVSALRQPGSAFKPILYAKAIEEGFEENRILSDAPVAFPRPGKTALWQPHNFSGQYEGDITLRRALTESENIPAVRLMEKVGPAAVIAFARRLGITTPLVENLSLALGSSGVTLLELTDAYAAFANLGEWHPPFGIDWVKDRLGNVVYRSYPKREIAMDPATAAIITDMLIGVVREGTGRAALCLDRTVGGKTGTTDNYRDAWFVGFSPRVAVGVWVGFDRPRSLGRGETGARAALPIWIDTMSAVLSRGPIDYFPIPDGVEKRRMDPVTGEILPPSSPDGVVALFRKKAT